MFVVLELVSVLSIHLVYIPFVDIVLLYDCRNYPCVSYYVSFIIL